MVNYLFGAMAGSIAYVYHREMQKLLTDHVVEALPQEMLSLSRNFDRKINEYLPSSNG